MRLCERLRHPRIHATDSSKLCRRIRLCRWHPCTGNQTSPTLSPYKDHHNPWPIAGANLQISMDELMDRESNLGPLARWHFGNMHEHYEKTRYLMCVFVSFSFTYSLSLSLSLANSEITVFYRPVGRIIAVIYSRPIHNNISRVHIDGERTA